MTAMRKIEPELITGMGYIGDNPGVLYRMGGAGEQTVVTGNPALLEGVKGSRFTSLAIHGKSSQGSTTGAQLFDKSKAFAGWVNSDGSINNAGTVGKGDNIVSEYIPFEAGKQYFCGSNFVWIYNTEKGFVKKADTELKGGVFTSPDNAGFFVVAFSVSAEKALAKSNEIMINVGSVKKTYEPYTGGAPSPSPSYPQEIENAGQSGEIGIEVGNNGYIQKGTYFLDVRPFSLKKGYTYHIKCEKIIENAINCFVLNEYNKNLSNGAILYDYGYTTKKLTIPNSAGIVDKECMMPMRYDRDYTFTVKAEGLYLYQAVNDPAKNTDEFYVGYAPNILNEEYKKQTIIIPTPGGLPGIPVSSGGNYTDKDGQQWVCDEIDLAKGERVQWIEEYRFTGAEAWFSWGVNNITEGITGFYWYYGSVIPTNHREILNTHAVFSRNVYGGREEGTMANIASGGDDYLIWSVRNEYLEDVSSKDAAVQSFKKLLGEINAKMLYCLATPIRTPLPPETIVAYKKLHTYSPTTTVINDAGAGMSVGYKGKRGIENV